MLKIGYNKIMNIYEREICMGCCDDLSGKIVAFASKSKFMTWLLFKVYGYNVFAPKPHFLYRNK